MSIGRTAVDILLALVRGSKEIAELVASLAGTDVPTVEERLERARAAIRDPIDVSIVDAARRAELDRILRGGAP
jgi:hypothetical protein